MAKTKTKKLLNHEKALWKQIICARLNQSRGPMFHNNTKHQQALSFCTFESKLWWVFSCFPVPSRLSAVNLLTLGFFFSVLFGKRKRGAGLPTGQMWAHSSKHTHHGQALGSTDTIRTDSPPLDGFLLKPCSGSSWERDSPAHFRHSWEQSRNSNLGGRIPTSVSTLGTPPGQDAGPSPALSRHTPPALRAAFRNRSICALQTSMQRLFFRSPRMRK